MLTTKQDSLISDKKCCGDALPAATSHRREPTYNIHHKPETFVPASSIKADAVVLDVSTSQPGIRSVVHRAAAAAMSFVI